MASDSGLERKYSAKIFSLDGFSDQRISTAIFASGYNGVYRRSLTGQSWDQVLYFPFGYAYCVRVDQRKNVVWASGGETCVFAPLVAHSDDKGESWQMNVLPFAGEINCCYSLVFHPEFSDIIFAGMESAVVRSADGGKSWNFTGLINIGMRFSCIAVDLLNRNHVYAGGSTQLSHKTSPLWESYDCGLSWCPIQATDSFTKISSLVPDPNQAGVIYLAATSNGVWRYKSVAPNLFSYFPLQVGNQWKFSEDQIETIIDSAEIADSLYFQFAQFHYFPNVQFRMTRDNKLLLRDSTTEQVWLNFSAAIGDTWRVTDPGGGSGWIVHLQSKADTVVVPAGTFTNCYRFWFQFGGCDNDWVEWYAPGIGPVQRVLYGIGLIEYPLLAAFVNGNYLPTKIDESSVSSKPDQFCLYPNYPNPFNATTVIPFDLPHSSYVGLEIYNIVGHKVRTLLAEPMPAGYFKVQWDGTDELKQKVASGIYFCRLQANWRSGEPEVQVKKLMLLR